MEAEDAQPDDRERLARVLESNLAVVSATLRGGVDAAAPLTALLAARTAADGVEQATRELVRQAREAGHTWQELGGLLAISRQAAQQRFGQPPADPEHAAFVRRAAEIVAQVNAGEWSKVTADWDEVMHRELGADRLAEQWERIVASAGSLEEIGRGALVSKGPYRLADVPLVFEHGPMKARVVFRHDAKVSGLFVLLPDAP